MSVFRYLIFIDFTLKVKGATLIFISGKEGKSGFIHNLVRKK